MKPAELEHVAQRYFDAWARRAPDEIAALHTESTRFCLHLGGPPTIGRAAARDAFAGILAQFPDFAFEIHRVRYGPRHWVLDWTLISGEVRFDCLDLVEVDAEGRVERKDTFVDAVQMNAARKALR